MDDPKDSASRPLETASPPRTPPETHQSATTQSDYGDFPSFDASGPEEQRASNTAQDDGVKLSNSDANETEPQETRGHQESAVSPGNINKAAASTSKDHISPKPELTSEEYNTHLLSDPRITPSARNNSSIIQASSAGRLDVVRLLLSDPRVDPSPYWRTQIHDAGMILSFF